MAKSINKLFSLVFLVFAQFSLLGALAFHFGKLNGLLMLWILALTPLLILSRCWETVKARFFNG